MESRSKLVAMMALALLGAGCAMDVPRMMKADANVQSQVMSAIGADSTLAGRMVDQLLGGESTRKMLLDQVMANGDAAQGLMMMVAQDETRLDAVLGLAMQDSSTKAHVMTLLKGMQMAGAR
jgi:hypothetical protein